MAKGSEMSAAGSGNPTMKAFIGRHAEKRQDWDAFPASRGYPELARAQIRYIGAGGAWEKAGDPGTLETGSFTMSIVTQMPGCYAASHFHECKEAFLALGGSLTVGWLWGDETIEVRLGYKDMCLNAVGRPHGFRNDGVVPVTASIMVGAKNPLPPQYVCHPKDADAEVARHFGAAPGKVYLLDETSEDSRHRDLARHVIRYSQQRPHWDPAGFARLVYIGDGGAPPGSYTMDLVHLPKGCGVQLYEREVEDVYLVLEGVVTAGWEEGGRIYEERLGPKDVIFNPSGRLHYFRNDGVEDAQFMMVVGSPKPEKVAFKVA
jgi:mannose-6-phosphate isomerase-like protein (cupin superfamily)